MAPPANAPVPATTATQPAAGAACPAAHDTTHQHLQGQWRAELAPVGTSKTKVQGTTLTIAGTPATTSARSQDSAAADTALLHLGPHPELAESVRGTVRRTRGTGPDAIVASALVSGDVDDGDVTLEESDNGTNISATWVGRVVEGSCGREIRGRFSNAAGSVQRDFVLRKPSGWQ